MILQVEDGIAVVPLAVIVVLFRKPVELTAPEVQIVPLLLSTLPVAPGATLVIVPVPFPTSTAFAVSVLSPVPPAATGSTPAVSAAVPLE